jgi:glycosyltransferase involved in cell wall biosynthesis
VPKILHVLIFFPRGGSAQVVRYLARETPAYGWPARIVTGSLGAPGTPGHARSFFGPDADLVSVPYDHAVARADPMLCSPPMHPSYEDRPGAPDRLMAGLDDRVAAHLVDEWTRILGADGVLDDIAVAHLHHLTPAHAALARLAPDLPVVTHLHGTELLMLDEAARGPAPAHIEAWRERMRAWVDRSRRVVVSSGPARDDANGLLGVDPARVSVVPNGVDIDLFGGPRAAAGDCHALMRRWLHDEPRGWSPARPNAGDVGYAAEALTALCAPGAVTVAYVGRFTAVKRAGLLVRAHARARARLAHPLPLVIAGGAAGEWEGEHPADAAARSPYGHEVFLAGWRSHAELAELLRCVDVLAVPSVAERFGQVYVEAMAAGVPPIACRAAAPATFIDDDPRSPLRCGWLVTPDDEESLADALVGAASDAAERRLRGENGRRLARERYSWSRIAGEVAELYSAVAAG